MNDLSNYSRYLFIFAHPDDEVYSCILIRKLISEGREVHAVYLTSGDAGGNGDIRESEALESMSIIGNSESNVHFLRIPEMKMLDEIHKAVERLRKLATLCNPDCVIGHDYEGGHEGHDVASYCASELVRMRNVAGHFVFPVYYGKPGERKGARFKPSRDNILELVLSEKEKQIKDKVLNANKSQKGHFDGLQATSQDYQDLLYLREVFHRISRAINYSYKPMEVIGYEFHRNGFKFSDFQDSILRYRAND